MSDIHFNLSETPGLVGLIQNGSESEVLKSSQVSCNGQDYRVIRYDKKKLTDDLIPLYGLCRSLIISSDGKVMSFSPPKSVPFESFKLSCDPSRAVAQEFVEGTMINLFWDDKTSVWEISTRSTIGATSSFYKANNVNKTFREMFMEAATLNGVTFDLLNPELSYSFVLQHPENRIVVPFTTPQLYLIAIYKINNTDVNNISITSYNIYDASVRDKFKDTMLKAPNIYDFTTYDELVDTFASIKTSYNFVGVVFYNVETGVRTKVRNPVYEGIRHLRGNQPKIQYQYLCLRAEGKVGEFLNFYPENKKEFGLFRDQIHAYTRELFQNYISCYIKKERPLIEFSPQYRTHMFNIHKIYTTELKEKKSFVSHSVVVDYVNKVHPTLLMYCLNFETRKKTRSSKPSDAVNIDLDVDLDVDLEADVKSDMDLDIKQEELPA